MSGLKLPPFGGFVAPGPRIDEFHRNDPETTKGVNFGHELAMSGLKLTPFGCFVSPGPTNYRILLKWPFQWFRAAGAQNRRIPPKRT